MVYPGNICYWGNKSAGKISRREISGGKICQCLICHQGNKSAEKISQRKKSEGKLSGVNMSEGKSVTWITLTRETGGNKEQIGGSLTAGRMTKCCLNIVI